MDSINQVFEGATLEEVTLGSRGLDANQHQGARAVYMNQARQTVDPRTGKTVSNSDPKATNLLMMIRYDQ
jgi:hypothetical protein